MTVSIGFFAEHTKSSSDNDGAANLGKFNICSRIYITNGADNSCPVIQPSGVVEDTCFYGFLLSFNEVFRSIIHATSNTVNPTKH